MPIDDVKKVCIVGAGTMGSRIALECAIRGYHCAVYDVSKKALLQAPERQKTLAEALVLQGKATQAEVQNGLHNTAFTADPVEAAENADLLSESVPEVLEFKREVHTQFDKLCPPKTILTTNTSSLLVSEIENAVQRGDRFAAMHFHSYKSVVDLVGGARTTEETMNTLERFVRSLEEIPIMMAKEKDGYLHNTMLIAFFHSAVLLASGGYGSIEDIDRSWMAVHESPQGPFGSMDDIGLDVVLDVAEAQAKRYRNRGFRNMADFVRAYVRRGELGVKTGKGFYAYPDPSYLQPDFLAVSDK